ncbi:MAG TPA: hypothetical protein DCR40_10265 [Prolixibacteraceae bacterium]|nr:hypothetical protein [Prolixibacteraceae bacterium]
MYIFEKTSGKFIFGRTTDSACQSGKFRIDPSADRTRIDIYLTGNGKQFIANKLVGEFLKADGSPYANFAELDAATATFFDPGADPGAAITVTGALTDAQLRATALPVSGPVTDTQLRASAVPVSGPLTDTQLRAAPLPSSKAAFVEVRLTRPSDTVQYAANDAINSSVGAPVSLNLPDMALANGRGGYLMQIDAASDMLNLADATLRLWFYRTEPTGIVGDNVAMTNSTANITNGRHYIDVKFNSLLAGSSSVLGQNSPVWNYVCDAASKDLKLRVQTLTAFTPTSGGFIDFTFTLTQL